MTKNANVTSNRQQIMAYINRYKLVAIIRLPQQKWVAATLDCLVEGGVKVIEITANTPGFCEEITHARTRHPHTLIGAGTITNALLAQQAIDAGAQFIVTPNVCKAVVDTAHTNDIPVLMGALTPTEIAQAVAYQADAIKLFPANAMGIEYCKNIMAPFTDVSLFAVGGINSANLQDWLSIGISGVGMGASLCAQINEHSNKSQAIKAISEVVHKLP